MKFYKYWSKAPVKLYLNDDVSFIHEIWGWSNLSIEDAKRIAEERAKNIDLEKFGKEKRWTYYPTHPIREEVLPTGRFKSETIEAVTTINSYGAFVLNVSTLPIIDIDFKIQRLPNISFIQWIMNLFGQAPKEPSLTIDEQVEQTIDKCKKLVNRKPELGLRLYRTLMGMRLIVTSHTFSPNTDFMANLFDYFQSDPLYVTLCKNQESYRARLSPKPFNIGFSNPRKKFPQTEIEQKQFTEWQSNYINKSKKFSVCHLLHQFGNQTMSPECKEIIHYHDNKCKAKDHKPLA